MLEDRALVEAAFADRSKLETPECRDAVERTLARLDRGDVRVASAPAEDAPDSEWTTHTWVKEAILLFFALRTMETMGNAPFEYRDKIPLKKGLAEQGVRLVPPGVIRYGAFCESGTIIMPAYVNIGARIGSGTMVDTWATVGSCAQVGKDCHLAGGVGIGGVLEPPNARPVVIEDGCFIGSRAVVVEGVRVGREAVIGAGVVLVASTPILDVSGSEVIEYRGVVPPRSVVVPGTRPKKFPAGEFHVPCALILGKRSENTDRKVSLNSALRDFAVPV